MGFVHRVNWQGACHATSAVLTILLREQKIKAEPFLGECRTFGIFFDHSWVEVDSRIYDVAISNSLNPQLNCAPVFSGLSVVTRQPTEVEYGVISGTGYDDYASMIKSTSFVEYVDNFSDHPKGLWGVAEKIGKDIGLRANSLKLKAAHSHIVWQERSRC